MSHDIYCSNISCDCDSDCTLHCDCGLIEAVRSHERAIRCEEKRISYLEGAERAYEDVLNLASDVAYEQGGCSVVHTCEFEQGVAELVRKLEIETGNLDSPSANEGAAACCVYEQGYSLREQYVVSSLKDYKEHTFPSDWAGHVAAYTDDPMLSKLFRACATEWGAGFADFDDEARSARDIKITPIGRVLLEMVEQRLMDGRVLPLAPPAPDSNEREQNLKYELEISDASDTHVPWCSDLDCFGCDCLHANTTNGVCDDCGENYDADDDEAIRASIGISAPLLEASPPEAELAALRDAARAAANDGRHILRSCWVCNPAHEHLRASDCLIECFGCGEFYYRGARITEDNLESGEGEISEEEAIFQAGRTMGVLDSIKAIVETWETHPGDDWDDAAQAFTHALDALLADDGSDKSS